MTRVCSKYKVETRYGGSGSNAAADETKQKETDVNSKKETAIAEALAFLGIILAYLVPALVR